MRGKKRHIGIMCLTCTDGTKDMSGRVAPLCVLGLVCVYVCACRGVMSIRQKRAEDTWRFLLTCGEARQVLEWIRSILLLAHYCPLSRDSSCSDLLINTCDQLWQEAPQNLSRRRISTDIYFRQNNLALVVLHFFSHTCETLNKLPTAKVKTPTPVKIRRFH